MKEIMLPTQVSGTGQEPEQRIEVAGHRYRVAARGDVRAGRTASEQGRPSHMAMPRHPGHRRARGSPPNGACLVPDRQHRQAVCARSADACSPDGHTSIYTPSMEAGHLNRIAARGHVRGGRRVSGPPENLVRPGHLDRAADGLADDLRRAARDRTRSPIGAPRSAPRKAEIRDARPDVCPV